MDVAIELCPPSLPILPIFPVPSLPSDGIESALGARPEHSRMRPDALGSLATEGAIRPRDRDDASALRPQQRPCRLHDEISVLDRVHAIGAEHDVEGCDVIAWCRARRMSDR